MQGLNTDSSRVIATCFALSAFAVAIVAGLAGGAAAAQILLRACVAMLICYPLGLMVGMTCAWQIRSVSSADSVAAAGDSAESVSANIESSGAGEMSPAARIEPPLIKSRAAA